ncbi:hypothetical protein JTB14_031015 [Gonioctena quinquepunctata]|nr:hypothetical protein JTB14_031015 [Gonioctena quinquepunctata]
MYRVKCLASINDDAHNDDKMQGKMRPKRGLTEKELLEELERGLSDIEGVSSDDSYNEEETQVRQRIGKMIDDVSEHLNEGDNDKEIENDGEEQGEGKCNYDDFITLKKKRKVVTECAICNKKFTHQNISEFR